MESILIIGNGISGITAARHIRKQSNKQITVISAESDHFFSRTALMYIYMGHMAYENIKPYQDWFWEKNKINLIKAYVDKVDFEKKQLQLNSGKFISYDKLILATGSKSNKFGWPGQDLDGVQGLYSLQDLKSMETHSKGLNRAVIVGGGLIGLEMAEMFSSRNIPVTMLVRESEYWSNILPLKEAAMISRHMREHHIDLRLNTELSEIVNNGNGKVKAVITKSEETIPCGFVGLTVGVSPNIDFLKESPLETNRGILVDEFFQTNIKDVFAIGDCAQYKKPISGRRPIEQVWYTGRMHGETVAKTICNKPTSYQPGVWFNSAKFLDIEYQVYGDVTSQPQESEDYLYWEHDSGKKSVRIVWDKKTSAVKGFNLMGIRYKHEVCAAWIEKKIPIKNVMAQLKEANFDPEFYTTYELAIAKLYNEKKKKNVTELV